MFEGWTSDLLASYLGQVLDIQQEQLKINLWTAWKTGISLEDVPLRGDLLNHVSVPLRLIQGSIGLLQVQIPWRALRSPIVVSLKDVHLTLGVMGEEDLSSEASEERYMAVKKAMLASQQLQAVAKEVGSEGSGAGRDGKSKAGGMVVSFLKHAFSLLLGRLQVCIESVKVTLTDSQRNVLCEVLVGNMSTVEHVGDFGLDKGMYVLPGSDGSSVVDFADELLRTSSWKNMQFKGIQCVWHHNAPDEKGIVMLQSELDLKMCYHIRSSPSQVLTTVEFKRLEVDVSTSLIRNINNLLENLEWLTVRLKYAHLRPASFCPKLMWRFALDGVLLDLKGPLRASRWKSYRESLHSRRKYILLYRKKLERDSGLLIAQKPYQGTVVSQKGDPSGDEQGRSILSEVGEKQLRILEYMLPISDILACRKAAKQSLLSSHAKQLPNRSLSSNNVFEEYELLDNPGLKSDKKSSWVKIPTLADLEDLFDAVDFDPDQSVSWHGSSLTVLAMVHVPRFIVNLRVECDQIEDYKAIFDNMAVGFASLVKKKAVGSFRVEGCQVLNGDRTLLSQQKGPSMLVQAGFSAKDNSLDVLLGEIELNCLPVDILVLSPFVPAPSLDSYWIEMMESAYNIGRKGYATTLASRLQKMSSSYNLTISTEKFQVALGELCLVCRGILCETKTQPETVQREQSTYSVLSALNHKDSVQDSFLVLDAIEMLEKILLFNHLQTTINSVCISCEGFVLLHSSQTTIDTKLNRVLGDCSQPAMNNSIKLNRISLRASQGVTRVLQDLLPESIPSFGEASSSSLNRMYAPKSLLSVNLPCFEIDLLDEYAQSALLELRTGEINFRLESSFQTVSLNLKLENFSLAILAACSSPLRTCNIWGIDFPFIAKLLKSSSIEIEYSSEYFRSLNRYSVKLLDFCLKGLESEPGNFISRMNPDAASVVDLCASRDRDSYVISASIFNMHLGYKTLLRLGCPLLENNQLKSSSGPSEASEIGIILKLKLGNVRCSYVHEHENYDDIPASYWDYAIAHPRVLSIYIDNFNLILPISQCDRASTEFCLSLRSFVVECGIIGQFGRPYLPIVCLKGISSTISPTSELKFLINIEELQIASHPSQVALLIGVNRILGQQLRGIGAQHEDEESDLQHVSSATIHASIPFKVGITVDMLNVSVLGAMGMSAALSGEGKQVAIQAAPDCGCISWLHFKIYLSQPIGDQTDLLKETYTPGKSESDSEICRSALSAFGNSRNTETKDESFCTPRHRNTESNHSLATTPTVTTNSFVSRYHSMESEIADIDFTNGCLDSEPEDFVPILMKNNFDNFCIAFASSFTDDVENPAICALEVIQNGCRVKLHSLSINVDLRRVCEIFGCINTYITIIKESSRNASSVDASDMTQFNFVFSFHDVDLGISARCPGSQFDRKSESEASLLNEFDSSFDEGIDEAAFLRLEGCMSYELRRAGRRIQIDLHKVLCFLVHINERKNVQEHEAVFGVSSLMLSFSNLYNRSIENIGPGVDIMKIDFSAKFITLWLREKDISCISNLTHAIKDIHTQLKELLDFSDGSTVVSNDTKDSATQLTLSAAIESLSVLCIATASNKELKSMLELEIDRIAFICANFALPLTTGSASYRIALTAINLENGRWESLLDATLFKLKFVLPSSGSDLIEGFSTQGSQTQQIFVSLAPANFTISESIVRTLSVCLQVFETRILRNSFSPDIQTLITSFRITNSMEHTVECWVNDSPCFPSSDEPNGVLHPGGIFYPSEAKAFSFCRAGYPSFTDGVKKDSTECHRRLDQFVFFRVQGTRTALIGPVPLTREESKLYTINFPVGIEEKLAIETINNFPGSWETTIHSTVRVSNNTPLQLEIKFKRKLHSPNSGDVLSISSGCRMWLPCSASIGFYSFRPSTMSSEFQDNSDDPYDWSDPAQLTPKAAGCNGQTFRIICRRHCYPSYHMVLKYRVDASGSLFVSLSPFLIVRNLLPIPCKVGTQFMKEHETHNLLPMEELSLLSWAAYTFERKITLLPENYMESNVVTLQESSAMVVFANDGRPDSSNAIEAFCDFSPQIGSHMSNQRAKLSISVNHESGSCIMVIQTGFWVYNYGDIPISLNWTADENAMLLEDEEQDIVPDSWIQPLSTARCIFQSSVPSMPGTSSARSFPASSRDFEESFGRGTPTSARSLHAVNMPIPRSMESRSSFGLGSLVNSVEKTCSPQNRIIYLGSENLDDGVNREFTSQSFALHEGSKWPAAVDSVDNEDLIARRKMLSIRVSKNRAPRGFTYWSTPQRVDPRSKFQYISVPIAPQRPQTSEWYDGSEHGIYPMVLNILIDEKCCSNTPSKISIAPQYTLVNKTSLRLQYKQKSSNMETEISPNAQCAIQWPDSSCPQQVCIRIFEAGWIWSGGFNLERSGDIFVKIRHRDRSITTIIRVEMALSESNGTMTVSLYPSASDFSPYRLENCSLEMMSIRQKGVMEQQDVLRPYCCLNYTWDEPSLPHAVVLECPVGKSLGVFDLEKVEFDKMVTVRSKFEETEVPLRITIRAEGPTRVLSVVDTRYHPSLPKELQSISETNFGRLGGMLEIKVKIQEITLSMIQRKREQFFVSLQRLSARCLSSPSRVLLTVSMRGFQIDNPSPYAIYPVLMVMPAPESLLSAKVTKRMERDFQPLHVSLVLWRKRPAGVFCFQTAEVSLRSFGMYLDQNLVDMMNSVKETCSAASLPRHLESQRTTRGVGSLQMLSLDTLNEIQRAETKKYYFDQLSISPTEITLSFTSSTPSDEAGAVPLLQQIVALADVEDARLWISGLLIKDTLMDRDAITNVMERHYKRAFVLEMFKLVGAANVFGDPLAMFHHIGLGFWEFLSGPLIGLIESARTFGPKQFILGMLSGTKGLLQNIVFAASNAACKASSAAHKAIVMWGFDGDNGGSLLNRRGSFWLLRPEQNTGGLLGAITKGIIGLVIDPVNGAERNGLQGFVSGVRHGALGVIMIPVAELLQMSAATAMSIRRAVAGSYNLGWKRPPRWIDESGTLLPYDFEDSMGRWILMQLNSQGICSASFGLDEYVCCTETKSNYEKRRFVLITRYWIFVVTVSGLSWAPKIVWSSRISAIEVVHLMQNGIRITANPPMQKTSTLNIREPLQGMFCAWEGECMEFGKAESIYNQIKNLQSNLNCKMLLSIFPDF